MMSTEKPESKIHYVRYEDILGAVIRPGRGSVLNHKTCGDSILIDFENNFFAVADSPERNPLASKAFLRKLHSTLTPILAGREDNKTTKREDAELIDRIVKNTNRVIKSTDYNESTTFTGVIIVCRSGMGKALLLHTGDSLLCHYRIGKMTAEKITTTNHHFVGRVNELYQVVLFDYFTDSRLLLATDGINDLLRNVIGDGNGKIEKVCLEILEKHSVDIFPEKLLSLYDMNPEKSDDLGLIAVNPTFQYDGVKSSIFI
ncbi:MAG TPA: protein phosphatase 2C family protein [Deltaproteobacteria bacterium]|nr:protein phosphatase 2C family protein [Deltaproteobacteria bacterium]